MLRNDMTISHKENLDVKQFDYVTIQKLSQGRVDATSIVSMRRAASSTQSLTSQKLASRRITAMNHGMFSQTAAM